MERDLLSNAERAALRHGLNKRLVVDADVHHMNVLKYLAPYMDEPWRRTVEAAPIHHLLPANLGDRWLGDLIKRPRRPTTGDGDPPDAVRTLVIDLARMGVDYSVIFPNDLLLLGTHPQAAFEAAVAKAYARWLTERVLPHEPRVLGLLYLPFGDARACVEIVEAFGDRPGVVGGLITGERHQQVQANEYMRVFAALEERDLAVGFHSVGQAWPAEPYRMIDSYLAAIALAFPFNTSIHVANVVLHGLPERFPGLRFVFYECGAAWLSMLMGRLDTGFLMRPSEAPLLTRRPSEYMREFFYTVQPIERPDRPGPLRAMFDMIGREQILYASDYPHVDFDAPSSILNLGFLSERDRQNILAENAVRAFRLRRDTLTPIAPAAR